MSFQEQTFLVKIMGSSFMPVESQESLGNIKKSMVEIKWLNQKMEFT